MRNRINTPMKGLNIVGKIDLSKFPTKYKKPKETLEVKTEKKKVELTQKQKDKKEAVIAVGIKYDIIWKNNIMTREELNLWAIKLLKLKIQPAEFRLQKLDYTQLSILALQIRTI